MIIYVDNTRSRVLQVGRDGKVDKVVDRVAGQTELVNHVSPNKSAVVPAVANDDRPAAKLVKDLLERRQAHLLRPGLIVQTRLEELRFKTELFIHPGRHIKEERDGFMCTYFLDQLERLSVRFFDGPLDERPQLLRHFVANQTESRHARLVVRNHVPRFESAASERVEILARIHRLVHIFQDLGRFDLEFKLVDFHKESR